MILPLQTAVAIRFLHDELHIVHSDVKPSNVMIDDRCNALINDFGLSHQRREDSLTRSSMRGIQGTPLYMDPYLLTDGTSIIKPCDVYSWAILVWEIFCTTQPFETARSEADLYRRVLGGERPDLARLPAELAGSGLAELLTECWDAEPARRPTMAMVVERLQDIIARLLPMGPEHEGHGVPAGGAAGAAAPQAGDRRAAPQPEAARAPAGAAPPPPQRPTINLTQTAGIIERNFRSFRHEGIHELLYIIRYIYEAGQMSSEKANEYLPRLYNALFTIATSASVNGADISSATTDRQIEALTTPGSGVDLCAYFANQNAFDTHGRPLTHPVLFTVLVRYIAALHAVRPEDTPLRARKIADIHTAAATLVAFHHHLVDVPTTTRTTAMIRSASTNRNQRSMTFATVSRTALATLRQAADWSCCTRAMIDLRKGRAFMQDRPFCNSRGAQLLQLLGGRCDCFCGGWGYGQNHPHCFIGGMHVHFEETLIAGVQANSSHPVVQELKSDTVSDDALSSARLRQADAYIVAATADIDAITAPEPADARNGIDTPPQGRLRVALSSVRPYLSVHWLGAARCIPLSSTFLASIVADLTAEVVAAIGPEHAARFAALMNGSDECVFEIAGIVENKTKLALTASIKLKKGTLSWPLLTASLPMPDVESIQPVGSSPEAHILDVLAGGRYIHSTNGLKLRFHHWNHDGHHSDAWYAYPFPDMSEQEPLAVRLERATWTSATDRAAALAVQTAIITLAKEWELAVLAERGRAELVAALAGVRDAEVLPL
jgi:hypothetical protein